MYTHTTCSYKNTMHLHNKHIHIIGIRYIHAVQVSTCTYAFGSYIYACSLYRIAGKF